MNALPKPARRHMTVPEFLVWAETTRGLWQLRDGEPEKMAPPSGRHGVIESRLAAAITNHLDRTGSRFVCAINPGVVPRARSDRTMLVPDIGITCTQGAIGQAFQNPVALIEILSPSNEAQTRAKIWAYTTIPSVAEIVVIRTVDVGAEILRRLPDGAWPGQPDELGPDGRLVLISIGLDIALRDIYRGTDVAPAPI